MRDEKRTGTKAEWDAFGARMVTAAEWHEARAEDPPLGSSDHWREQSRLIREAHLRSAAAFRKIAEQALAPFVFGEGGQYGEALAASAPVQKKAKFTDEGGLGAMPSGGGWWF